MHPIVQESIRITDPDALEIAHALDPEHLGASVALDAEYVQVRPDLAPVAAQHDDGNVAVDAATDFV